MRVVLCLIGLAVAVPASRGEDWQPLFNGRDLTNWRANNDPASFKVDGGVLRVQASGKTSAHLFFVGDRQEGFEKFQNFELEATVRAEPNSNGGIFVHCDLSTRDAQLHLAKGYEVQLNSSSREARKTGSLYGIVDIDTSPVDETKWFVVRVVVQDKKITIAINGRQVVDYVEPPNVERPPQRVGRRFSADGGAIALQAHDVDSVWYFKDIRVKRLPDSLTTSAQDDAAPRPGWQPNPMLLAAVEGKNAAGFNYREDRVPAYQLPDPLICVDGTRISTAAAWKQTGRPQTLELFRRLVYGRPPAGPFAMKFDVTSTDPRVLGGTATLKRVNITSAFGGKSFTFEAAVITPNNVSRKLPAFLLISHRGWHNNNPVEPDPVGYWSVDKIVARGYAAVTFRAGDVDADKAGDEARQGGVRAVWPKTGTTGGDDWGTIAAWAWGASRVLDYLETDPAIDTAKVAVVGQSRGGKASLWAGAEDERFALVVPNNSGCSGASLSRRIFGETVQRINTSFPHWFCENYKQYNGKENELPVDQHQAIGLVAPRAVYVASSDGDFWADQRGEFLALAQASPVYALFGASGMKPDEMPPLDTPLIRGPMAYHIRTGQHNLLTSDWMRFMDFADRLWPK